MPPTHLLVLMGDGRARVSVGDGAPKLVFMGDEGWVMGMGMGMASWGA
jgi:hypothetical protein